MLGDPGQETDGLSDPQLRKGGEGGDFQHGMKTNPNPCVQEETVMHRKLMKTLTCALAVLFVVSTLALAAGQKASGTVTAVQKEVVVVKGADGKTYEIVAEKVVTENLKTGDFVEYEIVEGKALNVKKKAK